MASVLYLTDTRYGQQAWQHPSARHRCFHYADALIAEGIHSSVVPMERVTAAILQKYDHVVFHRPTWNRRFEHALKCCGKASVQVHADYDDLIFDPEYAEHSPLIINGNRSLDKVKAQFKSTRRAAEQFDSFLVSTADLADKLGVLFPDRRITILPNSLPRCFVPPQPGASSSKRSCKQLTIGYFPGSRGHGEDFRSVISALKQIVSPKIRLLIVGRFGASDYADISNVVHLPFADYSDYLYLLARTDVSIAPLVNNVFNRSKSAVKLIESVAVGTPIVASANRDMADHDNALSSVIDNVEHWSDALTEMLENIRSENAGDVVVQSRQLAKRFSVQSRLPVLLEHLQCSG